MQNKFEPLVTILMATYNGMKFLESQIQSIKNQTYKKWVLIIRDDDSTDGTKEYLKWISSESKNITVIADQKGNLGACQNFSELLEYVLPGTFVAFCDQDDIWFNRKLELQVAAAKDVLDKKKEVRDVIVYGTFEYIDADGVKFNYGVPDFSNTPSLRLLLSQNFIYGCTTLISASMAERMKNIPRSAENHDYWLSLLGVLAEAEFVYIKDPMLFYRQHSKNVSGSVSDSNLTNRLVRFFLKKESLLLKRRSKMLSDLKLRFNHMPSNGNLALLDGFLTALQRNNVLLFLFCAKEGIRRRGFIQTLAWYLTLLRR